MSSLSEAPEAYIDFRLRRGDIVDRVIATPNDTALVCFAGTLATYDHILHDANIQGNALPNFIAGRAIGGMVFEVIAAYMRQHNFPQPPQARQILPGYVQDNRDILHITDKRDAFPKLPLPSEYLDLLHQTPLIVEIDNNGSRVRSRLPDLVNTFLVDMKDGYHQIVNHYLDTKKLRGIEGRIDMIGHALGWVETKPAIYPSLELPDVPDVPLD